MVWWPRGPVRARVVAYAWWPSPRSWLAPPLAAGAQGTKAKRGSRAWSWAGLMHRAFALDVLACPQCGGRLRLIATLHDPAVIRKLLAHLGMVRSGAEPRSRATRIQRRRVLIDSGRGGRRRASATRHYFC